MLVTAVETTGPRPVHFIVMDGPYKGVGKRDGSRLTIAGRATEPINGIFEDHGNDLIAEWPSDQAVAVGHKIKASHLPEVSGGLTDKIRLALKLARAAGEAEIVKNLEAALVLADAKRQRRREPSESMRSADTPPLAKASQERARRF